MTPEQALAEAEALYVRERPTGWRTFTLRPINVANRAPWYEQKVKQAYPHEYWEDAERMFYGDLMTVLAYVNAGLDPNLVGDLRYNFKRLCKQAPKIARRIHNEDPVDLQRRLNIFDLNRL